MLEHDKGHTLVYHFDSVANMGHELDHMEHRWSQRDSRQSKKDHTWDLGAGYEGALALARDGWEDGVGKVFALVDEVRSSAHAVRSYSVAGDFADVPRALSGDPFNMVRRGTAHSQRPTMTLAISCCASSATPAQSMANYAAAMVALVDRLENRGISVELLGCAVSKLTGKRGSVTWTIKRAGEALDLSAVAFSVGHPAMLRRLVFAAWERMPRSMEDYGYGHVATAERSDFIDLEEDALIINGVGVGNGSQCYDIQSAVAFAQRQINDAAGEPIAELEAL